MARIPGRPDVSATSAAPESGRLVLNAGSSSVKFALFSAERIPVRGLSGAVDGIGWDQGRLGGRAISHDGSKVRIEAFPTDEESVIARHTASLMRQTAVQEA